MILLVPQIHFKRRSKFMQLLYKYIYIICCINMAIVPNSHRKTLKFPWISCVCRRPNNLSVSTGSCKSFLGKTRSDPWIGKSIKGLLNLGEILFSEACVTDKITYGTKNDLTTLNRVRFFIIKTRSQIYKGNFFDLAFSKNRTFCCASLLILEKILYFSPNIPALVWKLSC